MGSTEAEWHRVGDSVQEGGRIQAWVKGRPVTVLRHHGKLFGIDSMCYHGGGPLGLGDIEEIDGKACLNCSWHHYKITIEGGEKLYQSTEFNKVAGPPTPLSLANLCCCGLALCRFDHTFAYDGNDVSRPAVPDSNAFPLTGAAGDQEADAGGLEECRAEAARAPSRGARRRCIRTARIGRRG